MLLGNPTSVGTNSTISSSLLISDRPLKLQLRPSPLSLSLSPPHFFLPFGNKAFLCSPPQSGRTQFVFQPTSDKPCGAFLVPAAKKRTSGGTSLVEMSDFEEDEFDDLDDDEGEIEEDEEEGMLLPIEEMKKWLENRPRGFGEGKEYDTSIEDKLFDEITQSRQAQVANINTLKNKSLDSTPKKDNQKKKAVEEVLPGRIRVRIVNLPKKKNIHRDLNAAFKDVRGIVNIVPAVTGNKKTKDPICKGFAFVDFKFEDDAARFVQQYSRQSIAFGKIQKQIKCELLPSQPSDSPNDEPVDSLFSAPVLMDPKLEGKCTDDNDGMSDLSFEAVASGSSNDPEDERVEAEFAIVTEAMESFSMSELNGGDGTEPTIGSFPSKKAVKKPKKKAVVAKGGERVPKLDIPGSAKRLKIKEKAMLNDVFAKYRSKSAVGLREGS